jgi:hypothetical protein
MMDKLANKVRGEKKGPDIRILLLGHHARNNVYILLFQGVCL